MVRITWPLALLILCATAVVARRPRMLSWVLVVFAVWFVVEQVRGPRRPR
jgi:hypothetical protein